ncbi:MAG: tyrosine-type recombinase/integrase [Oscillospiraceae bacterium]|nr:tyrosine-type recombinase/integrase [Oscillospiraceae bacterium]
MKTTEPIRNKKQVRELKDYYIKRGEIRNHLMIVFGIYTALRISDILRLTWDDVYDFENSRVRSCINIIEKKTGKSKIVALNKSVIAAICIYLAAAKPSTPLIINRQTGNAISRIQAYRIIRAASESLRFQNHVSCHSLRKTFGYHAWKGGVSPAVIMEIYNHSSLAVTRRYLGVTQDDKNAVYLGLTFSA